MPEPIVAESWGHLHAVLFAGSWNEPIPCNGVWTSKAWAHANRDTVIRFLKSLVEAISMMKALSRAYDVSETRKFVRQRLVGLA